METCRLALVTDKTMGELRKRVARQKISNRGNPPFEKEERKKMRKVISLIAVLALLTIPALAQSSDPVVVTTTAHLDIGCALQFSAVSMNWASIPVPLTEADVVYVPMDEPPFLVDIGWRLGSGEKPQFVLTTDEFVINGTPGCVLGGLVKFSFTAEGTFDAVEVIAPEIGLSEIVWTGTTISGLAHPTVTGYFMNTLSKAGGEFVGTFTFQVFAVVV